MADRGYSVFKKERTRSAYERAPIFISASLLAWCGLAYFLWGAAGTYRLLGASAMVFAAAMAGFSLALSHAKRSAPDKRPDLWANLLIGSLFIQGTAWGAGAVAVSPEGSPSHQALAVLWIAGLSGAAVSHYAVLGRAVLVFVIPALVPQGLYLLSFGDPIRGAMGVGALAFAASLVYGAALAEESISEADAFMGTQIGQRKKSDAQFNSLFHNAAEGLILHRSGVITAVNAAFLEIFGYQRGEEKAVIGKPLLELFAEKSRKPAASLLNRERGNAGAEGRRRELNAVRKDGSLITIKAAPAPYHGAGEDLRLLSILDVTGEKLAEQRAGEADWELETLIDNMGDFFFRMDASGRITRASSSAKELFGYSPKEMEGRAIVFFFSEQEDAERFASQLEKQEEAIRSFEAKARKKSGETIWISLDVHKRRGPGGEWLGWEGTVRDAAAVKKLEEELRAARAQAELAGRRLERAQAELEELIDNMQDVFFRASLQGVIERVSPSAEDVYGLGRERMEGGAVSSLFEDPKDMERFTAELAAHGGVVKSFEARIRRNNGQEAWISVNAHHYFGEADQLAGVEGTIRDITERKKMEETLREISQKDGLTGLFNRRHFDESLQTEWSRSGRSRPPGEISLILMDIDYFKPYNDGYGHQEGDSCLKRTAEAIQRQARRTGDVTARYGGEEMAVILPNTSPESALHIAEQMRKSVVLMRIPHKGSKACDHVTISAGVATMVPQPGLEPKSLIEKADKALYKAKEAGRNRVVVFGE